MDVDTWTLVPYTTRFEYSFFSMMKVFFNDTLGSFCWFKRKYLRIYIKFTFCNRHMEAMLQLAGLVIYLTTLWITWQSRIITFLNIGIDWLISKLELLRYIGLLNVLWNLKFTCLISVYANIGQKEEYFPALSFKFWEQGLHAILFCPRHKKWAFDRFFGKMQKIHIQFCLP
jgi:hypothetical protein